MKVTPICPQLLTAFSTRPATARLTTPPRTRGSCATWPTTRKSPRRIASDRGGGGKTLDDVRADTDQLMSRRHAAKTLEVCRLRRAHVAAAKTLKDVTDRADLNCVRRSRWNTRRPRDGGSREQDRGGAVGSRSSKAATTECSEAHSSSSIRPVALRERVETLRASLKLTNAQSGKLSLKVAELEKLAAAPVPPALDDRDGRRLTPTGLKYNSTRNAHQSRVDNATRQLTDLRPILERAEMRESELETSLRAAEADLLNP